MGSLLFYEVHCSTSFPRAIPSAWGEKSLYLEATKKKIHITDKLLDGIIMGIKEGSEDFVIGKPADCVVCRTVKRRPHEDAQIQSFSTAFVEHQRDLCQMTNHVNTENEESNRDH